MADGPLHSAVSVNVLPPRASVRSSPFQTFRRLTAASPSKLTVYERPESNTAVWMESGTTLPAQLAASATKPPAVFSHAISVPHSVLFKLGIRGAFPDDHVAGVRDNQAIDGIEEGPL